MLVVEAVLSCRKREGTFTLEGFEEVLAFWVRNYCLNLARSVVSIGIEIPNKSSPVWWWHQWACPPWRFCMHSIRRQHQQSRSPWKKKTERKLPWHRKWPSSDPQRLAVQSHLWRDARIGPGAFHNDDFWVFGYLHPLRLKPSSDLAISQQGS
jgi:hypothetical protein